MLTVLLTCFSIRLSTKAAERFALNLSSYRGNPFLRALAIATPLKRVSVGRRYAQHRHLQVGKVLAGVPGREGTGLGRGARGKPSGAGEGKVTMAASPAFVSPLRFLEENPEAVLAALRQGWVDYWETAVDQVTDEHVRFALQSWLLAECAAAFPDPRLQPEIPILVLLTASVAAAFQGEYGLRPSGCALHSPVLLAELGLNAAWLAPGA